MENVVNVGVFQPCTEAMGPGRRTCLWVRGCSIRCQGCATPEYLTRRADADETVDALWKQILEAHIRYRLEGISFSGGEPFEQARSLAILAARAHEAGLSVVCWTGYYRERLEGSLAPTGASDLLRHTDLLIDRPYIALKKADALPLRGSTNQQLHFLTDRYTIQNIGEEATIEAKVAGDGLVAVGVADMDPLRLLLKVFVGS